MTHRTMSQRSYHRATSRSSALSESLNKAFPSFLQLNETKTRPTCIAVAAVPADPVGETRALPRVLVTVRLERARTRHRPRGAAVAQPAPQGVVQVQPPGVLLALVAPAAADPLLAQTAARDLVAPSHVAERSARVTDALLAAELRRAAQAVGPVLALVAVHPLRVGLAEALTGHLVAHGVRLSPSRGAPAAQAARVEVVVLVHALVALLADDVVLAVALAGLRVAEHAGGADGVAVTGCAAQRIGGVQAVESIATELTADSCKIRHLCFLNVRL